MKAGTENRRKTIIAGSLGAAAVLAFGFTLYNAFGGDSGPTPPPSIAPVAQTIRSNNAAVAESSRSSESNSGGPNARAMMPTGNAPGVAATQLASASASMDPTLDQAAMLRTEHLVYSGSGRNIFSATYVPPPAKMVAAKFSARPKTPVATVPFVPPPPPTCPPSCPPINLKFFGTATHADGVRQAFLLQGDNVFLASQGDIVARRYRIVSISPSSIQVEDMGNKNTQTLPLVN